MSFERAASALVYSIVRERCRDDGLGPRFHHNAVVRFVLEQHGRAPDWVRLGVRALTALLDLWSLATRGRRVHALDHASRWRLVRAWRESRVGFCRDVVRFYEGLAVFGWHCERERG